MIFFQPTRLKSTLKSPQRSQYLYYLINLFQILVPLGKFYYKYLADYGEFSTFCLFTFFIVFISSIFFLTRARSMLILYCRNLVRNLVNDILSLSLLSERKNKLLNYKLHYDIQIICMQTYPLGTI